MRHLIKKIIIICISLCNLRHSAVVLRLIWACPLFLPPNSHSNINSTPKAHTDNADFMAFFGGDTGKDHLHLTQQAFLQIFRKPISSFFWVLVPHLSLHNHHQSPHIPLQMSSVCIAKSESPANLVLWKLPAFPLETSYLGSCRVFLYCMFLKVKWQC